MTIKLRGSSAEEVIGELAELVSRDAGELEPGLVRAGLIKRERMLSTAMGAGIAFPHCTSPRVRSPRFALGISQAGVDADAPDNKPVHLFFVVISPEHNPDAHLEALSAASRVFADPSVREKVLAAATAEEAIAAIADAEKD